MPTSRTNRPDISSMWKTWREKSFLLMESLDFLLLESWDKIILDWTWEITTSWNMRQVI